MPLEVIGTGFGRTGTDSMRAALDLLGFGPTHHMIEVINQPEQRERWLALAQGGPADWEHVLEGYRSCVDWPSAFYWRSLVAAYPEAKVILTWRTPESWWTSFANTILKVLQQTEDKRQLGYVLVAEGTFGGRPDDRAHAIAVYEAHVEEVVATVPADRLLVHKLGDGWPPLCAHLGAPVPDATYPRRNAPDQFFELVRGTCRR
jgi:hypothetical protein